METKGFHICMSMETGDRSKEQKSREVDILCFCQEWFPMSDKFEFG